MDILKIKFGSHLYGTETPQSDTDYKGIYIPSARDIVLQRVKANIQNQRPKAECERNVASDVDVETFALQQYLHLLAQGQTVAIDVFFAPDSMFLEPAHPIWREIRANQDKLITKKSSSFVGYCRQQANKYGIKGSRVAAARTALNALDSSVQHYPSNTKLGEFKVIIEQMVKENSQHMAIVSIPQKDGSVIDHWEVCGRKMSYLASIKNSLDIMKNLVETYGHRALLAEKNEGVDWKALSHAVRVAQQAIELLTTGNITFPLYERFFIKTIKLGKLSYRYVAEEIESLLVKVEEASAASNLRDEPDYEWIDNYVYDIYRQQVTVGFG